MLPIVSIIYSQARYSREYLKTLILTCTVLRDTPTPYQFSGRTAFKTMCFKSLEFPNFDLTLTLQSCSTFLFRLAAGCALQSGERGQKVHYIERYITLNRLNATRKKW